MGQIFNEEVVNQIHKALGPLRQHDEWDKAWWMLSSTCKFTVKSTWEALRKRGPNQEVVKYIWQKGLPFKISFFMCRLWKKRILIGEVLVRIKVVNEMKCGYCNSNQHESFEHLFVQCPDAGKLWTLFAGVAGIECPVVQMNQIFDTWWKFECAPKLKPLSVVVPSLIGWQLWKRRNKIRHGGRMSFVGMVGPRFYTPG